MNNKKIQFANLVCRSGNSTLLSMYESIIHPAFFDKTLKRKYGDTTYIFHDVTHEELWESNDHSGLVIIGRIVKDEKIRIEQILKEGQLQETKRSVQNSPSSVFVLFLENHRLAYVREHARAPSLQTFGSTLEKFVKRTYGKWIGEQLKTIRSKHPKSQWVQKREEFIKKHPIPTVDIIELSDAGSIRDKIYEMNSVNALSFDIIRTNDENNGQSMLQAIRNKKIILGNPSKTNLTFRDNKHSLDIEQTANLVEDAANDQNVHFIVSGKSGDRDVKYANKITDDDHANEQVTTTAKLKDENQTPKQIAVQAAHEFEDLAKKKIIKKPSMKNKDSITSKLSGIIKLYMQN